MPRLRAGAFSCFILAAVGWPLHSHADAPAATEIPTSGSRVPSTEHHRASALYFQYRIAVFELRHSPQLRGSGDLERIKSEYERLIGDFESVAAQWESQSMRREFPAASALAAGEAREAQNAVREIRERWIPELRGALDGAAILSACSAADPDLSGTGGGRAAQEIGNGYFTVAPPGRFVLGGLGREPVEPLHFRPAESEARAFRAEIQHLLDPLLFEQQSAKESLNHWVTRQAVRDLTQDLHHVAVESEDAKGASAETMSRMGREIFDQIKQSSAQSKIREILFPEASHPGLARQLGELSANLQRTYAQAGLESTRANATNAKFASTLARVHQLMIEIKAAREKIQGVRWDSRARRVLSHLMDPQWDPTADFKNEDHVAELRFGSFDVLITQCVLNRREDPEKERPACTIAKDLLSNEELSQLWPWLSIAERKKLASDLELYLAKTDPIASGEDLKRETTRTLLKEWLTQLKIPHPERGEIPALEGQELRSPAAQEAEYQLYAKINALTHQQARLFAALEGSPFLKQAEVHRLMTRSIGLSDSEDDEENEEDKEFKPDSVREKLTKALDRFYFLHKREIRNLLNQRFDSRHLNKGVPPEHPVDKQLLLSFTRNPHLFLEAFLARPDYESAICETTRKTARIFRVAETRGKRRKRRGIFMNRTLYRAMADYRLKRPFGAEE